MCERLSVLSIAAMVSLILLGATTVHSPAYAGKYGCYKVVAAQAVNIRKKAWSKSAVIATASRGEILGKWRAFCSLRGFWCPVQKGAIKGHASKKHLQKAACH